MMLALFGPEIFHLFSKNQTEKPVEIVVRVELHFNSAPFFARERYPHIRLQMATQGVLDGFYRRARSGLPDPRAGGSTARLDGPGRGQCSNELFQRSHTHPCGDRPLRNVRRRMLGAQGEQRSSMARSERACFDELLHFFW